MPPMPHQRLPVRRLARTAFAQADVIALIVLVLVFAVVVMALRQPARIHPPRTYCAANLRRIGMSFHIYAIMNNDVWPIVAHMPADAPGTGRVRYAPGRIGQDRDRDTTEADTDVSITRNLWLLVRHDFTEPESLVCPVNIDQSNRDANPEDFWDFASYSEVSYGYQVPFGQHGRPHSDLDMRMAIAADKGPFSAALETGAAGPGVPTADLTSADRAWRRWNSPNHGGEGQNVLFADASVQWMPTPLAGVLQDNIYTRWSDDSGGGTQSPNVRAQGTPPTSNETPFSDTDSLIYP